MGYTPYDRCVAKVRKRALSTTVNYRYVTVLLGRPCSLRTSIRAEAAAIALGREAADSRGAHRGALFTVPP